MQLQTQLREKLKALNETVWGGRLQMPRIEEWLGNFQADTAEALELEKLHALFLLSHFTFFDSRLMRALLRSLYRDRVKYPRVAEIRRRLNGTTNIGTIDKEYAAELASIRFIGIGNPSESGTHLLYYFRQENGLKHTQFVYPHECLDDEHEVGKAIRAGTVRRLVFLDDFCGSGTQAKRYFERVVEKLKKVSKLKADYHVLFATNAGLDEVRRHAQFDDVSTVCELDDSFKCFSEGSRYFRDAQAPIDRNFSMEMCRKYGKLIEPSCPLGYGGCELLLGFEHNIPNNTLPVIWSEGHAQKKWLPAFRRYRKGPNW